MTERWPAKPPWIKLTPDDDAVVAEIEKERPRGAALIAGALVDERLAQTIKLRLLPISVKHAKPVHGALFGPGRPLQSHFVRIQSGFLLQLYPYQVLELLVTVNEIRNKFAHTTAPIDFETPEVAKRCDILTGSLLRAVWMGDLFLRDAIQRVRNPRGRTFDLPKGRFQITGPWSRRESFLQTCKCLLYLLARARDVYANEFVLIEPQGSLPGILEQQKPQPVPLRKNPPGKGRQRRRRSSRA